MVEAIFKPDFLLESETARRLYHQYADPQPIIDYHCHLNPQWLASNHRFSSLTELWLSGDHYKWRAMRANGIAERCCSGDASDWEKFDAWARTVPRTLRNPLYHWTHLELKNPFGIVELLNEVSSRSVFERAGELLADPSFSTHGLLRRFGVVVVCTTDDPVDSLEHHRAYAASSASAHTTVVPTWRADAVLEIRSVGPFNDWVRTLEQVSGIPIDDYDALLVALDQRHLHFHNNGCRLADHGLEALPPDDYSLTTVREVFGRARNGQQVSVAEAQQYQAAVLHELGVMNHSRGWCQQYHLGALRNTNSRLTASIGANVGVDSIGDAEMARPLARFLDRLERQDRLAKTILYNLNPRDNDVFATMVGNFQDGRTPGKLQYGASWWFLDQLDGMRKQIDALSNHGLLSRFVGMLTDSRSIVSYSRHEYFRRLLCNLLGDEMERGLLPGDLGLVGNMVGDICFRNARDYFGLPIPSDVLPRDAATELQNPR